MCYAGVGALLVHARKESVKTEPRLPHPHPHPHLERPVAIAEPKPEPESDPERARTYSKWLGLSMYIGGPDKRATLITWFAGEPVCQPNIEIYIWHRYASVAAWPAGGGKVCK